MSRRACSCCRGRTSRRRRDPARGRAPPPRAARARPRPDAARSAPPCPRRQASAGSRRAPLRAARCPGARRRVPRRWPWRCSIRRLTLPIKPGYRGGRSGPVVHPGRAHRGASHQAFVLIDPRGARRRAHRLVHRLGGNRAAVVRHTDPGSRRRVSRRIGSVPSRRQLPAHSVVCDRLHARRDRRAEQRPADGRGDRPVGARPGHVPRDDQRARHEPPEAELQELAEVPQARAHRAQAGADRAVEHARQDQGAAVHPGRDPRQRVGGDRRLAPDHRAARHDPLRHGSRGRHDPRQRGRALQRDPQPGRPYREPARRTGTTSISTATS